MSRLRDLMTGIQGMRIVTRRERRWEAILRLQPGDWLHVPKDEHAHARRMAWHYSQNGDAKYIVRQCADGAIRVLNVTGIDPALYRRYVKPKPAADRPKP
jgi:hypothetical protein